MHIRRFTAGDEPDLFQVYLSAIHCIASRDYAPDAWAPRDFDQTMWRDRVRAIDPFVALREGKIVGYADVQPNGCIDHFFVSGHHPRQGIGSMLMDRIHLEAGSAGIAELSSDVSTTAQPFFERHGFQVVAQRMPVVRRVAIPNARMRKVLAGAGRP